ncbi:MAG: 2-oxoglutarate dehydrogenase E1 component [Myxococcota bacterium]|jgi:2-oxoglutarate dehydrogenase E1 component|nr:2-oxoglutarate dehydrogenase E1 component [Myxococcota bacterium]
MDFLTAENGAYLESKYQQFLADPLTVEEEWRHFFEAQASLALRPTMQVLPSASESADGPMFELRIAHLINAYRSLGHLGAQLDPLAIEQPAGSPVLEPAFYGFSSAEMGRRFATPSLRGPKESTLAELLDFLRRCYCRSVGCEIMHITDASAREWLLDTCEGQQNRLPLDGPTRLWLLEQVAAAQTFESFLHRKFVGAKRFSLEGGEALIPLLSLLIEEAAMQDARQFVLGMAHRGRLNVLVQLAGKSRKQIFREFADVNPYAYFGRGDVKYHLGHERSFHTRQGHEVRLGLMFNPSHLEFINPVTEGVVRLRQNALPGDGRRAICPLIIHGDAAFIGQGVVAETLNLMALPGYSTGGTVHIVVNNQIGFTTAPQESRSSVYCTDVAKMNEIPVFHVNGEDPFALAHVARTAAQFRQRFQRDVIIDLYCFRRYGHNETDEPRFTQPQMYANIDRHPSVFERFAQALLSDGLLTPDSVQGIVARQETALEADLAEVLAEQAPTSERVRSEPRLSCDLATVTSAVSEQALARVFRALYELPEGFAAHRVLARQLKARSEMAEGQAPVDWASAELLAYGSLLLDGVSVRLSGQDSQRGTFSHRHAYLRAQDSGALYVPLQSLCEPDEQDPQRSPRFEVYNSPLSEAAVLGFEFGYSLEARQALVLWEAQFGDFANGAQVIIDQFIASAFDKWGLRSGLVLLLPHGYEGQGPDHSSARLERFLQLACGSNMRVCNPTTPAQFFHLLRAHALSAQPQVLVVMSPKSLLRHREVLSSMQELCSSRFQCVLPDPVALPVEEVKRVVLSSGKVFYELMERRAQLRERRVALLRLEQVHPFPEPALKSALERFPALEELLWCQEEPENMGAKSYLMPLLQSFCGERLRLHWVSRASAASTATGSPKAHRLEQNELLNRVFEMSQDGGETDA